MFSLNISGKRLPRAIPHPRGVFTAIAGTEFLFNISKKDVSVSGTTEATSEFTPDPLMPDNLRFGRSKDDNDI